MLVTATASILTGVLSGYIPFDSESVLYLLRKCKMCIRDSAHTYGVYPEEIDGLKRDYEKLWGEVSKVLRELSELVAK